MTTDWQKADPKPFDSGPDEEVVEAMDIVKGEVGSAKLKDPSEIEEQGTRRTGSSQLDPERPVRDPEAGEGER